ncbi:MAG: PAS domain-containing protein [Anaerolineales bacterium]|nr:PAS domain-containing protein [Anaerolineales bacterium]
MRFLKNVFAPPKFQDGEKTYQAYLLNIILLTLIVIPIPFVIYLLVWQPGEIQRTLVFIAFAEIINITLLALARRGFVRQVAIAHVLTLWLIFATSAATRSGVHGTPYALGNGLVITVTGILLGRRSVQLMTWLVIIQGGIMVYAELNGWKPSDIANDPVYTWAIAIVLLVIVVNMQMLASDQIRMALHRAQTSEEKYRLISKVSSDFTFSAELDSKGEMRLAWVAGAFEKMTGFTFEEYTTSGGWLAHIHPDDLKKEAQNVATLQANQPTITEIRAFKKNGDLCWLRVYSHPIWDEKQNKLIGTVGAVQDITQQKLGEIALTQERDLLQTFMDNIPDQVYFKDTESRFIRINKAQANFLKLSNPEDAIGKTDLDFLSHDLAQQLLDEEKQILVSGQSIINRVELHPTEDGKPRWVSATKAPVRDSSGDLMGIIGVSRDITEEKRIDAMLAQERDILQIFMDNTPNQVYFKDTESRFVRVNQAQANFLGIEHPKDAIGKTDLDFQTQELAQEFLAEEKQIMETGQPILNRIEFNPTKDGKSRWLSTSKVPAKDEFGYIIGTIGMSFDITQQKLIEEQEVRRREILEKVVQLGKQVAEVSDLRVTLEKIWYALHEGLGFDRVGIFAYQPESNTINRLLGTDIHGNRDDTVGEPVPISAWHSFQNALIKPDGYYFTHNFSGEATIPEGHEMYTVKDYATVAAWAGGKPVAVISVDQLITQRPITEQQLDALRLFAGYAGLAIENSHLKEALQNELEEQKKAEETEQRRRQILEKVMRLGKQVTEVSDLRTTLGKIWRGVRYDLDFDRVGLFTYDQQENIMIGAYGTDSNGNMWDAWHVHFDLDENALFYKILRQPDGFFFSNNFEVEFNLDDKHDMKGVKHCAMVALWSGNNPMAIISVDQFITQRPITDDQLEALRLFAGYAGLAISNAHLNDALERELLQRQNLINELEAKNVELERFTYTASHDLKSPLVTITGFLGYLEKDALAGNQERMKSSIDRINSAAEKMQALLNDLLELSRIGRLMNPPEDVPFEEIVNEAIDHVRGRLDGANAIIEVDRDLPKVHVDRARLVEVIQNLIENAVKYSKPGINPRIEIGSKSADENAVQIFYVRDNGMGIDPQYHERIFGLFNKLDPQSEGTGIGLSLVKRIIEVHGGRVWVESEKGKGATFYFSLPTS